MDSNKGGVMKFAVLLDEEHGKTDFATKKNNERIIIEADNEEEVMSYLSNPEYVYNAGFKGEDVFKPYHIIPLMEY